MKGKGAKSGYSYFTVATPSGGYYQYDPKLGIFPMVRPAAPKLLPAPAPLNTAIPPLRLEDQP
jgi:hypothetical protein